MEITSLVMQRVKSTEGNYHSVAFMAVYLEYIIGKKRSELVYAILYECSQQCCILGQRVKGSHTQTWGLT
jgi:hypothetical protein